MKVSISSYTKRLSVMVAAFGLLVAACGPTTEGPTTEPEPTEDQPTTTARATTTTASTEVAPIKIGVAISETGVLGIEAGAVRRGYELWAMRVNEAGGINVGGQVYPVELIFYDDESDPDTAVRLVERAITVDEVDFIFGPYGSGLTIAVSAVTEQHKVPLLAGAAAAESVYDRGLEYVFGPLSLTAQYYVPLLEAAAAKGAETIGIIHQDSAPMIDILNGTRSTAERLGMEIVAAQAIPEGSTDVTAAMTLIAGADPDVFIGAGNIAESILFVRAMHDLGWTPRFAFMQDMENPEVLEELGDLADGIGSPSQWRPSASWQDEWFGSAADYNQLAEETFGIAPSYLTAGATATALALQLALEQAGTTDREAVRDALASLGVETFFGHIGFSDVGDPSGLVGANLDRRMLGIQILGGRIVVVAPGEAAEAELVELVPWEER